MREQLRGLLSALVATACLIPGPMTSLEARALMQQKPKTKTLPPLKRMPTPADVVKEHLAAINECNWERAMAQYPDEVQFFLPGGQVVKGRQAVGELFSDFFRSVKDGGLCGLKFEVENTFPVGDTINMSWRATADFLAEPYRGADAYVTRDGLMWAQVTTFDVLGLKKK